MPSSRQTAVSALILRLAAKIVAGEALADVAVEFRRGDGEVWTIVAAIPGPASPNCRVRVP